MTYFSVNVVVKYYQTGNDKTVVVNSLLMFCLSKFLTFMSKLIKVIRRVSKTENTTPRAMCRGNETHISPVIVYSFTRWWRFLVPQQLSIVDFLGYDLDDFHIIRYLCHYRCIGTLYQTQFCIIYLFIFNNNNNIRKIIFICYTLRKFLIN